MNKMFFRAFFFESEELENKFIASMAKLKFKDQSVIATKAIDANGDISVLVGSNVNTDIALATLKANELASGRVFVANIDFSKKL